MRAGIDEQTTGAGIAGIEGARVGRDGSFAQQRLGQLESKAAFANADRADEEVGMRQSAP